MTLDQLCEFDRLMVVYDLLSDDLNNYDIVNVIDGEEWREEDG